MEKVSKLFIRNQKKYYEYLYELLRIKSVTKNRIECKTVAQWISNYIKDFFESKIIETSGNPIIISRLKYKNEDRPSILFYGHYDVQPAELLEKWVSPPFEPTIRDERLFARGIGDNKGHFFLEPVGF